MNRRNLLKRLFLGAVTLACPSLLKAASAQEELVDEMYGKYVSHRVYGTSQVFETSPDTPGIRYVRFPLEYKLEVRYENVTKEYITYNLKHSQIEEINNIPAQELVDALREDPMGDVCQTMELSLCGVRFSLARVVYTGNNCRKNQDRIY
jgi:hypothetical protein